MQVVAVNNSSLKNDFLNVPKILYKNDKNWICPLDSEVENVFNPKKNNFFNHGKCTCWVLKDDRGNLIGRVAAFINEKKAYNYNQPTGGMGFFECIDNQSAAFLLFDTAKEWLTEHGMQAMDGPINFGENDSFWGLLVEGFTPPSFGMNYNFPYYKKFFEAYGFVTEYEQLTNHINLTIPFP